MSGDATIAEIAVEVGLAKADFAELAWSLWLQAAFDGESAQKLEVLAARIGLGADVTGRIAGAEYRHAELIGEAHRLLKALVPYEAEIKQLLQRETRP